MKPKQLLQSNWERILKIQNEGIYFIHIGKCGGSTIYKSLEHRVNEQNYYRILIHCHCAKPKFIRRMRYIVSVRSPLSRFVSAFNWRYYLLKTGKKNSPEELAGLEYFKTPNNLANALGDNSLRDKALNLIQFQKPGKNHPEHMQMGIGYYLSDFVTVPGTIDRLLVVRQEHLLHDLQKQFKVLGLEKPLTIPKEKQGYSLLGSSVELDETACRNLIDYYVDDYKVLETLSSAGLIDSKYIDDSKKYPCPKNHLE